MCRNLVPSFFYWKLPLDVVSWKYARNDMKTENLETRVMERITRKRSDVFLRADFKDLGGYDQVGRVLRGPRA